MPPNTHAPRLCSNLPVFAIRGSLALNTITLGVNFVLGVGNRLGPVPLPPCKSMNTAGTVVTRTVRTSSFFQPSAMSYRYEYNNKSLYSACCIPGYLGFSTWRTEHRPGATEQQEADEPSSMFGHDTRKKSHREETH